MVNNPMPLMNRREAVSSRPTMTTDLDHMTRAKLLRDDTWACRRVYADHLTDASDAQKAFIKDGLHVIERVLGANFPALARRDRHPICSRLNGLHTRDLLWFGWLGSMLERASHCRGFDRLVGKLRTTRAYDEAIAFLIVIERALGAGFKVEIEPDVSRVTGSNKRPDLVMQSGDDPPIYVEVAVLGHSLENHEADETLELLVRACGFVNAAGRFLASPSDDERATELARVVEARRSLSATTPFVSVTNEVVEVGLALDDGVDALKSWAAEKGMEVGGFSMPPLERSGPQRHANKVEREQKQIPAGCPGIVFIVDRSGMFSFTSAGAIVERARFASSKSADTIAAAFVSTFVAYDSQARIAVVDDDGVVLWVCRDHGLVEIRTVVFNRQCVHELSEGLVERVTYALLPSDEVDAALAAMRAAAESARQA